MGGVQFYNKKMSLQEKKMLSQTERKNKNLYKKFVYCNQIENQTFVSFLITGATFVPNSSIEFIIILCGTLPTLA